MAWVKQRTDLQINEIYRAIYKYGYLVYWEKASRCPCLSPDSGQPNINDSLCKGKGWYYSDPQVIRGIMTNFSENLKYNQTGEVLQGISYFTTLPQYKLCERDRIIMFHSEMRFSEILTHKEHGGKDHLRFPPTAITSVRSVAQPFQNKLDYLIDKENSAISWIPTGEEPPVGEQISVDYKMHPRWIIIDASNVIRDTYVKSKRPAITYQPLPQKVTVRLEYFVPFP